MKAIMKQKPGFGAEFVDTDIPVPGNGEVLVKVINTSICGTDVHIYNWDPWSAHRIKPPIVFGHEFAGEIVELGPGVRSLQKGEFVSAETHIPCGHCHQCRTGNMHLCSNLKILGVDVQGCFAEYAVIPEICAWKNSPDIPHEQACIQEPFGNAIHAVQSADVRGKNVLVLGDGPIGIMTIPILKKYGARRVIMTGMQDYRLALAGKFAPDMLLDIRKDDVDAEVMRVTNGIGADVVLEMSGAEQAIKQALRLIRRSGELVAFGIPGNDVTIEWSEGLIFKGITIHAINGRKMFDTWYKGAALLEDHDFDISPVISHVMPFNDFHKAQELLKPGSAGAGKIVLEL